ncbi:hypothetical protein Pint_26738 [Pistacia integerrima]|uniref:Uncharacterized protein n=1 Tax=Pistacia integerrima TaxID=434235 RepID=A0ACC0YRT0_9ROSI|nr:hypothetical protein Pint_26738 [Pistacia integerrima]
MAFLQRLILNRKPVLYGNCRRSLCSSLSAVPSDDYSSSSLPPSCRPLIISLSLTWLNIVEGKMQYLFNESGRRCLDAFAGIVTVSCGHCHPDIVNAITEQNNLFQHATTVYLHHAIAGFAEALA